jgi:putative hydrolase of the HAD superfamily
MIQVIYFDLGKVIIDFDYTVATQELVKVTPLPLHEIALVLSDAKLIFEYETGRLSSCEYYQMVCRRLKMDVSMEKFAQLWGNMFLPQPLLSESLLTDLKQKYRLILLSNTNEIHFEYVSSRYPILDHIQERLLSYQVGCMKPDPRIFELAVQQAKVAPEDIFFTDDRSENIEAARQAGIQAVQFRSEQQLIQDMQQMGISVDFH